MNKYILGDNGERVPSYGGKDPKPDRPEKEPDIIQVTPVQPDPIPTRAPATGGPRLIPDLQFGNPSSSSSNAGSANSSPRGKYSLFGNDRLNLGDGAFSKDLVDARREDRKKIQKAEEQLRDEEKQTRNIEAAAEAIGADPAEKTARIVERIIRGLNGPSEIESRTDREYNARRLVEIIIEQEQRLGL